MLVWRAAVRCCGPVQPILRGVALGCGATFVYGGLSAEISQLGAAFAGEEIVAMWMCVCVCVALNFGAVYWMPCVCVPESPNY